ncbi:MAG TPA: pitrilysin family protein [Thermodesulfovibrionales bacterium]|nr:pitrilysin family protein [Thermodesulfovibrionales bacterium]
MKSERITNHKKVFLLFLISLFTGYLSLLTDAHGLDIRRSVLSNGLTMLYVERHNLPIVMVSLLVKASLLDEPPDKAGLANLTAELLTEGTGKRKATNISEEIEFIGASLGATTSEDYTLISLSVLKKDVERGFEILSDVVLNPTFPDEEIRRNKELIKGSLKQSEEEPSFVASKAFRNAVYGDLSYGRLTRGSVETIDRITREEIVRFHSDLYRPNNAVLSVVGDLTEDELSALIKKFFSLWQRGDIAKRASVEQPRNKKQTFLVDRELTQANIIVGHTGINRGNPDYYAVSVMNYILGGGGFSSRLMQTVRDEMGLAYDIHSFFAPYKEGGLFEVGVQTKNESASTVINEIYTQVNRIRKDKVSEQELDDAKAYLTGSFPRKLDTNRKIADFLVTTEFYDLGLDYVDKYPQYIRAVTADDVLRVAGKYLDTLDMVTVVVGKQSKISLDNQ